MLKALQKHCKEDENFVSACLEFLSALAVHFKGMTSVATIEFGLLALVISAACYCLPCVLRKWFLLACSVALYCAFAPWWTFGYVLMSSTAVWASALLIGRMRAGAKPDCRVRLVLVTGLVLSLGVLAVLKYSRFFVENLNVLFAAVSSGKGLPVPELTASLGVSYYTLQIVGYLLDCYWGVQTPQSNPFKFLLFSCWFPQMVSGPICRYSEIGEALVGRHVFDYQAFTFGVQRMVWGFFKKLIVAERLGFVVAFVYKNPEAHGGLLVPFATMVFLVQLYADFSGCIDILSGFSECLGVKMPDNFRMPFLSRSTQEFWQRWHITLGAWMRDYVFYPLLKTDSWVRLTSWSRAKWGKREGKKFPVYIALFVLWMGMGLWHGGAWHHVIGVGVWFWTCIVLSMSLEAPLDRLYQKIGVNGGSRLHAIVQVVSTFCLVSVGELFFRSGSLGRAVYMVRCTIHGGVVGALKSSAPGVLGLQFGDWVAVAYGLCVMIAVGVVALRGRDVRVRLGGLTLPVRWLVYYGILFSVYVFGSFGSAVKASDFIYARF